MSESLVGSDAFRRGSGWARIRATSPRDLVGMVAVAGVYYGSAKVGYQLSFSGPVAAIVWLPVGVGIAFLTLGGLQLWPGILVGDLLANGYATIPVGSAIGQTFGNLVEVVIAAALLRRLVRNGSPLGSVGGLARMVLAIAGATALSATIGSFSLNAGHVVSWPAFFTVWRTWWLGDASGALLVVPLALAWWPVPRLHRVRARLPEGLALVGAAVVLSEIGSRSETPLAYLGFPALIWAGLRFGTRGASAAVAVTAGIYVWNTTHYAGPFQFQSITQAVLDTQLYIAVSSLSTLCLAAVVAEREAIAERLGRSRAELVNVAESERRRLERNLHDGAQQRLLALALNLGLAAETARRSPEAVPAMLLEAEAELQVAVDELRDLAHGMPPSLLRNLGLANAVRAVALQVSVPTVALELGIPRLDDVAEATAFYVVSEAIANAQRHSQATSVSIRGSFGAGRLRIEIVDDGTGGAVATPGTGLEGLEERVDAMGGTFVLESPLGRGTRIEAAIPARLR